MRLVLFDHVELSGDGATIFGNPFDASAYPVIVALLTAHNVGGGGSVGADLDTSDDGVTWQPYGGIGPTPAAGLERVAMPAASDRAGPLMRARASVGGSPTVSACLTLAVDLLSSE